MSSNDTHTFKCLMPDALLCLRK